ncbi:hypothetical protein Bca101_094688 [Brassica carinata]
MNTQQFKSGTLGVKSFDNCMNHLVPSLVFFFSLELYINFVSLYTQVTELPFFASKVRLGRCGIDQVYGLGPLNEYER